MTVTTIKGITRITGTYWFCVYTGNQATEPVEVTGVTETKSNIIYGKTKQECLDKIKALGLKYVTI